MLSLIKKKFVPVISIFFFAVAVTIHQSTTMPELNISKQDSAYNIDNTFLRLTSFGNKKMISNVFWISTLLESDLERYKARKGSDWMYLRFLTIANLDPEFYENYLFGGMYLSVVKDDLIAAAEVFELGLRKYPDDYKLNYYAGFNYFFEMGDYEKGFEKLKRIEFHPNAPMSLRFVINKLRFETTGQYDVALAFLKESYSLSKDMMVREKLANDIYSVVAQRDLECLNAGKSDCNHIDAKGIPYYRTRDGQWKSRQEFSHYKIFRPKEKTNKKGGP